MTIRHNHWYWIGAGALALALLAGAASAWLGDDSIGPDRGSSDAPATADDPGDLPQAAWSIRTFAAGTAGPPTKADRKAVERERQALIQVVTAVADAVALAPGSIGSLAGKELSRSAAKALEDSALPIPERVGEVQLVRRKAAIGLDAPGGKRAAAKVTMLIRGTMEGETVKIAGDSRLYLKKRDGRWQVIAFDGERAPKASAPGGGKSGKGQKSGDRKKGRS